MADDQWVEGYESGMEQGYAERDKTAKQYEKQARAEVLAACRKRLKQAARSVKDVQLMRKYTDAQVELVTTLLNDLADNAFMRLQPAALDLEALLREAELKGLKSDCIGVDDRLDSHNHNRDCVHCQRIAELEKACVSEGEVK
ncbi:hypothetical protein LCGC14_1773350 [marine sediment metagenome]|uniref:Uncharacterized protein n=1 Tax=marine sediment metagenome TaxID=412755 RepID=A0A0F9GXM2_9ZZZZ